MITLRNRKIIRALYQEQKMNGIDLLSKFLGGKGFTDLFLFLSHVELLRINVFLLVFNLFLPRSLDIKKFGLKVPPLWMCKQGVSQSRD